MKKLFKVVAVAVLSLGFGLAAKAQETVVNRTMTASAEVLAALELEVVENIEFGRLSSSTPGNIIIDPTGVQNSNVGTTAQAGIFELTAAINKSVRFGWPTSIELLNTTTNNPEHKMIFTLSVAGNGVNNQGQAQVKSLTDGAFDTNTSDAGKYFLYVGGSIPALNGQQIGEYSGDVMLTVEYN